MYLIMLIWKMEFPWEESWDQKEVLVRLGHSSCSPIRKCLSETHQDHNVHASLGQQVKSILVVLMSANSRTTQQLFFGIFRG